MTDDTQPIIVMGVQGCGKSTVGQALADSRGMRFVDGDALHSVEAKAKMSAGHPLTDEDRQPWLTRIAEAIAEAMRNDDPLVVACSALRVSYRDLMRDIVPNLYFVQLEGSQKLIAERLSHRNHEYMPPTLLDSQFATLEPLTSSEDGVRVDLTRSPAEIVGLITTQIGQR